MATSHWMSLKAASSLPAQFEPSGSLIETDERTAAMSEHTGRIKWPQFWQECSFEWAKDAANFLQSELGLALNCSPTPLESSHGVSTSTVWVISAMG
jgi:hypothetical protein